MIKFRYVNDNIATFKKVHFRRILELVTESFRCARYTISFKGKDLVTTSSAAMLELCISSPKSVVVIAEGVNFTVYHGRIVMNESDLTLEQLCEHILFKGNYVVPREQFPEVNDYVAIIKKATEILSLPDGDCIFIHIGDMVYGAIPAEFEVSCASGNYNDADAIYVTGYFDGAKITVAYDYAGLAIICKDEELAMEVRTSLIGR